MDWLDVVLGALVGFIAFALVWATRDGMRYRRYEKKYGRRLEVNEAPERDEQGRRNLPPNAASTTGAALNARLNEVSISLQEHLKNHHEWSEDEVVIARMAEMMRANPTMFWSGPEQYEIPPEETGGRWPTRAEIDDEEKI